MICTDLYNRISQSSDSLQCVQERLRGHFMFVLCLFLPVILMLAALPCRAQEKPGEDTLKPFPVFQKIPEHNKGHLYANSNWSHDGTKIAVMVHDLSANNTATIWVYHIATKRLTQITHPDTIGMKDTMPVWSPDDTQIAFASDRGGGLHVWVVDEDGENLRRVTEDLSDRMDIWSPKPYWTPDGQNLVFSDEVDGNRDIYRTSLLDGSVVRLTDDPSIDEAPRYSPDGKYISFVSNRAGRNDLWVIDNASGEKKKLITEISDMLPLYDWSPDSQWIAIDVEPPGFGWRPRTVIVSVQTGRIVSVPAPALDEMDYATWAPSWSPDGRSVLYSSYPLQTYNSSLKVLDLETEEITSLRDSLVQVDQISWSPDNKQVAYFSIWSAAKEGVGQDSMITLVNTQGDGLSLASFSGKNPDWSPTGLSIACVTTGFAGGSLAFYDVDKQQTTVVETGHEGRNHNPRFSPDGELLAYITKQGEDSELWVYDTLTQDHLQLTFSGGIKRWITWSPDGENIVFGQNSDGPGGFFDLWAVPAYGGKNRRITVNEQHDGGPLWHKGEPDPIFYASQRGNRWELWKTDLGGNENYVLRSSSRIVPVLKQNPSDIYYRSGERWENLDIYVTNTDTKTEKQLTESGNIRVAKASPDATMIAYTYFEEALWDQGVLWIAEVGDLLPSGAIP
jgi:Tol biopolymer transport system component